MQFGVFDHLDDAGVPAPQLFAERLELVAGFEAAGFERYQLAEHHGTPLGYAPSPNLFLAAAAQRTSRIRLGALVNLIPIHDPLRLLEEICMLDNLSGGRLDLGLGRGASPVELAFFGVPSRDAARDKYGEGLSLILRGMTSETLTFEGEHYTVRDYPLIMRPVQKPHPPIWTGTNTIESARSAGRAGTNVVSLGPVSAAREVVEAFLGTFRETHAPGDPLPCLGLVRHVVVAEDGAAARRIASRAYTRWRHHMNWLWERAGTRFTLGAIFPETYAEVEALGHCVAGTPEEVRDVLHRQIAEAGVNYLPCQMVFGDMTFEECRRSTALFAAGVMPGLRSAFA
jgi:alkanesulfonate monooxygenase SsuD/methylene tetrahydromethanopterin reductase-like flavin-dependent oxidoreductase (luciferase family)